MVDLEKDVDVGQASPEDSTSDRISKVLALITRLAEDSQGRESAGARAVDRLQGHDDREAFLREMVMGFRPPEADPELWLRWLSGGVEPFASGKPAKPRTSQVNTKREISRASKRVSSAKARVEQARQQLAEAEAEAAANMELESALITWALMERITSLVSPIFAMGPAWTLMRVVGPYVDPDDMEEELILETPGKERDAAADRVRADRMVLSSRLHEALDLWAGDPGFESELRDAITKVVDEFEARRDEARASNRKLRSKVEMQRSIRPQVTTTSGKLLDMLRSM